MLRVTNRSAAGAVVGGSPGKLSVTNDSPKFAKSEENDCPDALSMFATPVAADSSSLRQRLGLRQAGGTSHSHV